MSYNPNAISSIASEEERRRLLRRGVYRPGGEMINPETGERESPAVQESHQRWMQQQYAKNLISQGAIGVNFGTITPFNTNTQIEEMANQSVRQGGQPGALLANQPGMPQMGGIAAESADIRKNIALANRNKEVFLQERDRLWDLHNKQFEEDVRRQKLGMGEMSLQEQQLQLAKNIDAFEETQRMRPVTERLKVAQLEEAEAGINRRQYYERLLLEPQQTPQQTANAIATAKGLKDINATWPDLKAVSENYNIPKDTIAKVYNGQTAITYDNPLEFVRDIGIKMSDLVPITNINKLDASTTELITIANQNNRPPDQALREILKDLNINKGDKNYVQTALDVAYGIQEVYNENGKAAKQNLQTGIAESNAQQANKFVAQAIPLVQQVAMPDVVKSILASKQNMMDALLTASEMAKTGGTKEAGYSFGLQTKAFGGVGINPRLAESMSPEQIRQDVFDYLIQENINDKQFVNFMREQKDKSPSKRNPQLQIFADAIVAPFNEGKKKALEEAEKEQVKRDKIVQDYANKEQEVYFDPANGTPHILPKGSLSQLATLSTPEREAYLREGEVLSQKQLSDPAFQLFINLKDEEKNNIRQKIELAKMLWKQSSQTGKALTTGALDSLKELGIGSVKELPSTINAYSEMYGLGEVFEETKEAGFWSSAEYEVISGMKPEETIVQVSTEMERKTPDGRIAIFDSNTKQFLRYK